MRKAFIGSFVLHVLVVIGVFQWIAFSQVSFVPRPVYSVELVGEPSTSRPAAAVKAQPKPTPVEEKKEEEPKEDEMPAPPTQIKKPKPVEKKETEVPTTDITKTNQKPDSSLVGDTGATEVPAGGAPGDEPAMGSVSFDGGDFPFASYVNRMRQKIATAWEVPVGTEGLERSAVIYFRVRRDGGVSNVTVEKSSGLQLFDRSCQRAVIEAAPLPPLPREYKDDFIGVHFSFLFQPSQ